MTTRHQFLGRAHVACVAALAFAITVGAASGAITKVATGSTINNDDQSSYSYEFNAGAADKLIVSAATESVAIITGITYNGEPMTLVSGTSNSRNRGIWYLDNPYTGGAANIVVSGNGGTFGQMALGIASIAGSGSGYADAARADATSVPLTVSANGSFVFAAIGLQGDGSNPTANSPLTQIFSGSPYSMRAGAGYALNVAGGASTFSFTTTSTQPDLSAAAFAPFIPYPPNAVTAGESPVSNATEVAWNLPSLSWVAPTADGTHQLATGYEVYFGTNSTLTDNAMYTTGTPSLSTPGLPLLANTTYTWGVVATNAVGPADSTNVWTFTTSDGKPTVDNGDGPTSDGPTSATLSGQVVATNGAAPSVVSIYYGNNDGDTNASNWDAHVDISWDVGDVGTPFSTNVTGLYYGETYYYSVYASNTYGEAWSTVTNFTTVSSWIPTVLPGTEVWFDAADTSTITAPGGAVSQWNDKSGNANHATQGTGTQQPSYDATNRKLTFDGGDILKVANDPFRGLQNFAVITVQKWNASSKWNNRSVSYDGEPVGWQIRQWDTNYGHFTFTRRGTGYDDDPTPSTTVNNSDFIGVGVRQNSQNLAIRHNGSVTLSSDSDTGNISYSGSNRSAIGGRYAADNWTTPSGYLIGEIKEIIVIENPTTEAVEKSEGYLANKWGLTLASGHPYEPWPLTVSGLLAITNTSPASGSTDIPTNSVDLVGTLDATNSVFSVWAYYSMNTISAGSAWYDAYTNGTASRISAGTYTNVTGHSVTGEVQNLLPSTTYYYTLMATNAATNIWASDTKSFTTEAAAGQISWIPDSAAVSTIKDKTATFGATLACLGTNAYVSVGLWKTSDSSTTNWYAFPAFYEDDESTNISYTLPAESLATQTEYNFKLRATNDTQSVEISGYTFTTHDKPEVDNASGASAIRLTTATLWGQVTATNGVPLDAVRIYFGDNNGGTTPSSWDTNYVVSGVSEGVAFSQDVTDLVYGGNTYYYTVYASNAYGEAWSTVTNFASGGTLAYASGGDVIYTTNDINGVTWKVHIFTNVGPNTLTFRQIYAGDVEYLIVGGGGGGGDGDAWNGGSGGGAGGLLTNVGDTFLEVAAGSYTVTVGGGGAAATADDQRGSSGDNSSISGPGITTITALGGGGGGGKSQNGLDGGSGGGACQSRTIGYGEVGQGHDGAKAGNVSYGSGGGGGGAGAAGGGGDSQNRIGGAGLQNTITGTSVWYAGGGSGNSSGVSSLGGGGSSGVAGTDGLGGGGGGSNDLGARGGSGIVIVRYIPLPPPGTLFRFY